MKIEVISTDGRDNEIKTEIKVNQGKDREFIPITIESGKFDFAIMRIKHKN